MVPPNLNNIVDTRVPVSLGERTGYLNQLRQDVLPHIRKLQADRHLRWFSFLIHAENGSPYIHLRLEPTPGLDIDDFIELLPKHFQKPHHITLSKTSGLDRSILQNNDWAYAWKILGEASEWILCLLEGYKREPSLKQIVQFLHFITNPLMLGHQCLYRPESISF
jgi:hypothetical protein